MITGLHNHSLDANSDFYVLTLKLEIFTLSASPSKNEVKHPSMA